MKQAHAHCWGKRIYHKILSTEPWKTEPKEFQVLTSSAKTHTTSGFKSTQHLLTSFLKNRNGSNR